MIELTDTNSSAIAAEFVRARTRAGSPAMGMVMTLIIVVPEDQAEAAMKDAQVASHEHPARVLGVVKGDSRGKPRVDAQVGMALYSARLPLGEAIAAPLRNPPAPGLWPTVVTDQSGLVLGLVWSTRESVAAAVRERAGVYWSRSRNELWRKGATSGATQRLLRIDLDCDRDALRFTVQQEGTG